MIANLDVQQFSEVLYAYLISCSSPNACLTGHERREASIREIKQALEQPGATVFVCGDLDAGAPPTEQVAQVHQYSAACHGAEDATGVSQRLRVLLRNAVRIASPCDSETAREVSAGGGSSISLSLRNGSHGNQTIRVLIDQFGHVTSDEERRRFENLLQEMSERRNTIRFVLCGVSQSLYELLRAHESCYEYGEVPGIAGLGHVESIAADHVASESATPHHVHIVPEMLFCEMLSEPTFVRNLH